MTCPVFSQVRGHDAAEGSGSTGHHVGRVGREFGWEGLGQARARAETRDERCSAADGDLILGFVGKNVLADTRRGLRWVVGVVDVDQSAPSVDELLVADDSAEPPDGGLFDGESFGSRGGLGVGGDHVQAGPNVVVVCEGFDEMQDRENTEMVVDFSDVAATRRIGAMSSGQQLMMPARSPSFSR